MPASREGTAWKQGALAPACGGRREFSAYDFATTRIALDQVAPHSVTVDSGVVVRASDALCLLEGEGKGYH